mmetsp:Transcript_67364/g.196935  ORF Transcript_67364/g.196935 Transcript_67364/m.196935 type:complete len:233 (-) Transcript_67364:730-1428(-)
MASHLRDTSEVLAQELQCIVDVHRAPPAQELDGVLPLFQVTPVHGVEKLCQRAGLVREAPAEAEKEMLFFCAELALWPPDELVQSAQLVGVGPRVAVLDAIPCGAREPHVLQHSRMLVRGIRIHKALEAAHSRTRLLTRGRQRLQQPASPTQRSQTLRVGVLAPRRCEDACGHLYLLAVLGLRKDDRVREHRQMHAEPWHARLLQRLQCTAGKGLLATLEARCCCRQPAPSM